MCMPNHAFRYIRNSFTFENVENQRNEKGQDTSEVSAINGSIELPTPSNMVETLV